MVFLVKMDVSWGSNPHHPTAPQAPPRGTWPCLRRPPRQGLGADLAHEAVEGAVEGAVTGDREAPQQQILPVNRMG